MSEPAQKKLKPTPFAVPVPEAAKHDSTVTKLRDVKDVFTFLHFIRKQPVAKRDKLRKKHGQFFIDKFYETHGQQLMDTPEGLHLAIYALDQIEMRLTFSQYRLRHSADIGKTLIKTDRITDYVDPDAAKYSAIYRMYNQFVKYRRVEWMYDANGKTVEQILEEMK
jgi:hypothetical protein